MITWIFTGAAAAAVAGLWGVSGLWGLPELSAQGGGSPSLRPYVHIFLAYAAAWILILVWVWRIWRSLRRLGSSSSTAAATERTAEAPNAEAG